MKREEASRLAVEQQVILDHFQATHPELNKSNALRFCLARKWQTERIEALYQGYLQVIKQHGLEKISFEDVKDTMQTGILYSPPGRDKQGAGLFVITCRKYEKSTKVTDLIRLAFYLAEQVTMHPKTQRNGLTLVIDLYDCQWSQFDSGMLQKLSKLFQNSLPCSLKSILLYKSPWWATTLVKMVTPFLKEKLRQRIHVTEDLIEYINPDQLPVELGGSYAFHLDMYIREQIARVDQTMTAPIAVLRRKSLSKIMGLGLKGDLMVSQEEHLELQRERLARLRAIDSSKNPQVLLVDLRWRQQRLQFTGDFGNALLNLIGRKIQNTPPAQPPPTLDVKRKSSISEPRIDFEGAAQRLANERQRLSKATK